MLELRDYLWLIKQGREPFRFFLLFNFLGLESVVLFLGNFHDVRNEVQHMLFLLIDPLIFSLPHFLKFDLLAMYDLIEKHKVVFLGDLL